MGGPDLPTWFVPFLLTPILQSAQRTASGPVIFLKMQNSGEASLIGNLDRTWVSSIKQKLLLKPKILKDSSGSSSCCIHRVPQCLHHRDQMAYTPQIISIGPLHHGKKSLQAMEEHKWKYFRSVLSRAGNRRLQLYLMAVKELEESARRCYSETIDLDSNEFVEMLVVDGFFIIELICKATGLIAIDASDPIFSMRWILPKLKSDLLMLENQIPFFLLQRLFDLMRDPGHESISLAHLALEFFKHSVPKNEKTLEKVTDMKGRHLLHLLHLSLLPHAAVGEEKRRDECHPPPKMIYCVSELREAGIKFKKAEAVDSFLDIKFRRRSMEIPPLSIQDCTKTLLLNLIAFEQCYGDCTACVTAYADFMKCVVRSGEDAAILRRSCIIENWLGGDDEVAHLFNEIGREVSIPAAADGFYLGEVIRDVDRYCRTDCHARRSRLKHKYFSDPWPILACCLS